MWAGSDGVGKTEAAEDTHVIVCWVVSKEEKVRCGVVEGRRWTPVEDVGSGVESFDPERRWEVRVNEKHTEDIIGGSDESLRFPVLWRGVRARKAEGGAVA